MKKPHRVPSKKTISKLRKVLTHARCRTMRVIFLRSQTHGPHVRSSPYLRRNSSFSAVMFSRTPQGKTLKQAGFPIPPICSVLMQSLPRVERAQCMGQCITHASVNLSWNHSCYAKPYTHFATKNGVVEGFPQPHPEMTPAPMRRAALIMFRVWTQSPLAPRVGVNRVSKFLQVVQDLLRVVRIERPPNIAAHENS